MNLKESLDRSLKRARSVSEELLAAFQTPEAWTHPACPGGNHALWFAGHMGVVDNDFIAVIDPTKARPLPAYKEKFARGSQPTDRPRDYPPAEEVLGYMRERRSVLLALLDQETDERLGRATPTGSPWFLPDIASVFEVAAWHEGLHSGQMSIARRALGHAPVH